MEDIDLLTPGQAAEIVGVSRWTVMRWFRERRLPGYRLSTRIVRFERRDVEAFIVRRREHGAEAGGR